MKTFPFLFSAAAFSCRSAACVCFSQKAEVNCLAGEQTAVAITGSETENARMLISHNEEKKLLKNLQNLVQAKCKNQLGHLIHPSVSQWVLP